MLVIVAALLELAAGVGLAYVAGFGRVSAVLGDFHWTWLLALFGALFVSFAGYFYAYRGVSRVEGGPALSRAQLFAVVVAGVGGIVAPGGGALDRYLLEAAGADEREARVRAVSLTGLEHGVLAVGGCGTAIALLVYGIRVTPASFTIPWAVLPVPGFLLGFWVAERYRDRFRDRAGWRGRVGTFLDAIHIIREVFVRPHRWGQALVGMALFWAADAFAAWAGLAAFGFQMNAAALFVGFASGMVFSRRSGPLAGAGILALALPVCIWACGAPFAAAVVGVFAYRMLCLWLPMPVSLAVLPTLRKMAERGLPPAVAGEAVPQASVAAGRGGPRPSGMWTRRSVGGSPS